MRALGEGGFAREPPVEAVVHGEPGVAQRVHVREPELEVVRGHARAGLMDRRDERVVNLALEHVVLPELEAVRAPRVQRRVAGAGVRELLARVFRVADEPGRIGHADCRWVAALAVHVDAEVPARDRERAVRDGRRVVRRRRAEPERVGAGLRERRHLGLPLARLVAELARERVEVAADESGHVRRHHRRLGLAGVDQIRGRNLGLERRWLHDDLERAVGAVVILRRRLELHRVGAGVDVGVRRRGQPFARTLAEGIRHGLAVADPRFGFRQIAHGKRIARVVLLDIRHHRCEDDVRDGVFRARENQLVLVGRLRRRVDPGIGV